VIPSISFRWGMATVPGLSRLGIMEFIYNPTASKA
jgi:hypothetical protein